VILLAILMGLEWKVMEALTLGQLIQLPIAITATLTNYLVFGPDWFDLSLIFALSVSLSVGVIVGSKIAHHVDVKWLKVLVALVLVIASCFLMIGFIMKE